MITPSDTYKEIIDEKDYFVTSKILVYTKTGTTVGTITEDDIFSMSVTKSLYSDSIGLGSCVSAQLDLSIKQTSFNIPIMAKLCPYIQIYNDTKTSEWIPKGTFFIDTRSIDKSSGFTTITALDSMMKAEQIYADVTSISTWGQSATVVATEIANIIECNYDTDEYSNLISTVGNPISNEYTMREVLSYIAVANAGNWIITDDNYLHLIKLSSARSLETNYLITETGYNITFGGDRINV